MSEINPTVERACDRCDWQLSHLVDDGRYLCNICHGKLIDEQMSRALDNARDVLTIGFWLLAGLLIAGCIGATVHAIQSSP